MTLSIDVMLMTWEFWAGVVLGLRGYSLFVVGAWVKRDFRGRPLNRWYWRARMAQGVFTFALAAYLMLISPLTWRFPYRIAIEWPLYS